MKFKALFAVILTCCLLFSAAVFAGTEAETIQRPSAFVPAAGYTFPPVMEGTQIMHDFIMQNKGTAPLKIEKVRTG